MNPSNLATTRDDSATFLDDSEVGLCVRTVCAQPVQTDEKWLVLQILQLYISVYTRT